MDKNLMKFGKEYYAKILLKKIKESFKNETEKKNKDAPQKIIILG